jgi:ADP-heptose:LPS heptosyltransferase
MANLDLVISIDSAVAHLAGALGVPTWVMLKYSPDWRWLLDRKDSPWYSSIKLFRQRILGEWDDVATQIVRELQLII